MCVHHKEKGTHVHEWVQQEHRCLMDASCQCRNHCKLTALLSHGLTGVGSPYLTQLTVCLSLSVLCVLLCVCVLGHACGCVCVGACLWMISPCTHCCREGAMCGRGCVFFFFPTRIFWSCSCTPTPASRFEARDFTFLCDLDAQKAQIGCLLCGKMSVMG